MANIKKTLKFKQGRVTETDPSQDAIAAKSLVIGGVAGTEVTKSHVDTLIGGASAEASSLHQHDQLYYRRTDAVSESEGEGDADRPIKTNAEGKIDPSLFPVPVGTLRSETRVLTTDEIASKSLVLETAPSPSVAVKMYPVGGIPLVENFHFVLVAPATISWSGYEIEDVFEAGDEVAIEYFA